MSEKPSRNVSTTSLPGGGPKRRRTELLLPDGTKVLVASPEDAKTLRAKYAAPVAANPDANLQVEIVVHGSDEHQEALRKTQSHHAARLDALRAKFGDAFVGEWESVSSELGRVTSQLERLTDHSRSLNANFSKFGFDARLRTYANEDEKYGEGPIGGNGGGGDDGPGGGGGGLSSSSSSTYDGASSSFDWSEKRGGTTLKLFKRPVIKQYFHKGLLWRSSEASEVMSFELFFDLLYGMC